MPRLEDLTEAQRNRYLAFPCLDHDDSPFTPPKRPLSEGKIALVTSAGLYLRGDPPFISGDTSYWVIPSSARAGQILQSHASIEFDRAAFYRDINVTFPMDRLQELVTRGAVGSLANNYYSFMGALGDPRGIVEHSGPEVARRLIDEGVDFVLLTPT